MGLSALIVTVCSSFTILISLVIYSKLFPPHKVAQARLIVASYKGTEEAPRDKRSLRRIKNRSLEYSSAVSLLRKALLAKLLIVTIVYTSLLFAYTLFLEPLVPAPFDIPFLTVNTEKGPQISVVLIHFFVFMLAILVFSETSYS
ncbi:MAG: hypothetical protein QXN05_01775 [Acidilobaceae archaeon]